MHPQNNIRRKTLRSKLTNLIFISIVPIALSIGIIIYTEYVKKHQDISERILETSRNFAMLMDQELDSIFLELHALSTSPFLDSKDYPGFHAQAKAVLKNHPDADIILADPSGQQLANSYLPFGAPLPKRNIPERLKGLFATGSPSVSGIFKGAVTGRVLISVDLPVLRDGRVAYDLAMTVPVDNLISALSLPKLPAEWTATILDGNGVVVCRTRDTDKFVGKKPYMPVLARHKETASEGVFQAIGLTGIPVLAGYSQSVRYGWTMIVSVPNAHVMLDLWSWLWLALGGVVISGAAGAGFALRQGFRIDRSVKALRASAAALGKGEKVAVGHHDFIETFEVAEALATASDVLQARNEELRACNAETERRSILLSTAMSAVAGGLIILDSDRKVLRINTLAQRMFPFLQQGSPLPESEAPIPVTITASGGSPVALEDIPGLKALRGETILDEELQFQFEDGRRIWASVNAAPVREPSGIISGAVISLHDITERKSSEKLRTDIDRIIRHDIRSPLAGLSSVAHFILTEGADQIQNHIPLILKSIDNVIKLLDSSDKIAQMEHGSYHITYDSCNCEEMFNNIRNTLKGILSSKKLLLDISTSKNQLYGEEYLLEDMLRNLIKNAVEASPSGATVTVSCEQFESSTRISIRNQGIVPQDIRDRFFDKFATSGKAYGTGLGTYSARLIAKAHGGDIEFASSETDGTTVTVTIPLPPGA